MRSLVSSTGARDVKPSVQPLYYTYHVHHEELPTCQVRTQLSVSTTVAILLLNLGCHLR